MQVQASPAVLGVADRTAKHKSGKPAAVLVARVFDPEVAAAEPVGVTVQVAAACLGMGDKTAEYRPPITFVVVQKRHHTRLFPNRPNEGDRSGNILPGIALLLLLY